MPTYGPDQRIVTAGTTTHLPAGQNQGIRLHLARAGRITKLRYCRHASSAATLTFQVWNPAGVKLHEETHTASGAGFFEFTLSAPVTIAAAGDYTFSMFSGGSGATHLPPPAVTPTDDCTLVNYYERAGLPADGFPNTVNATFGVQIEPTFQALVWAPGDAWPGTTDAGAYAPAWGGYVKLFLRAKIAPGNAFHLGPHPYDRLDAGNVLSGAAIAGAAVDYLYTWSTTASLPPAAGQARSNLPAQPPDQTTGLSFADLDRNGVDRRSALAAVAVGSTIDLFTIAGRFARYHVTTVQTGNTGYIRYTFTLGTSSGTAFPANGTQITALIFPPGADPDATAELWVDLACDATSVTVQGGSSSAQGVFSKADAATLEAELFDPAGIYDPTNRDTPYAYGGRPRLVAGVPVECFAEIVDPNDYSVSTVYLFTGTADSWAEDWTPHTNARVAKLTATDATKVFVRYDRPETAPEGAGDTTAQRVTRIVDYFDWPGIVHAPGGPGTVTLQATTLAQSAWELLNRTMDDELGAVWITPAGELRWVDRSAWLTIDDPVLELGCESLGTVYDVLTDATPSAMDVQLRNIVHAANTGGIAQTASSDTSRAERGDYEYSRTDLGMETDAQAGAWAAQVIALYAFPTYGLDNVTLVPALSATSWELWLSVLSLQYVVDLVRVLWRPPDLPDRTPIDLLGRVVGAKHTITRTAWTVEWTLVDSGRARTGSPFTLGPHAFDRLDAGNIVGA